MITTLPPEVIQQLSETSIECLKCGTGRLEIIDSHIVFCPECSCFFDVADEKADKNLLHVRGSVGPRPDG